MKNRAKCKLCHSIIESFHIADYVSCKCGHISVSGGSKMECGALDWNNFLRVDDLGNEIIIQVKEGNVNPLYTEDIPNVKPTREELLNMLQNMIKEYEALPEQAMRTPITHYDFLSYLLLLSEILRS